MPPEFSPENAQEVAIHRKIYLTVGSVLCRLHKSDGHRSFVLVLGVLIHTKNTSIWGQYFHHWGFPLEILFLLHQLPDLPRPLLSISSTFGKPVKFKEKMYIFHFLAENQWNSVKILWKLGPIFVQNKTSTRAYFIPPCFQNCKICLPAVDFGTGQSKDFDINTRNTHIHSAENLTSYSIKI